MSETYPSEPVAVLSEAQQAKQEQVRLELEHRFRHCLRSGCISPLLHLMIRYKMRSLP